MLPLQSKLEAEIGQTERAVKAASSASGRKDEDKKLIRLRSQVAELLAFQDRLQYYADQRIELDLDDGVVYNYTLFAGDDSVDRIVYQDSHLKMDQLYKASRWKRDLLAEAAD